MVAVRDVVIPLALWASQEKEDVLFRPAESYEGGPSVREGKEEGFLGHAGPSPTTPCPRGSAQPRGARAWTEMCGEEHKPSS